VTDIDRTSSPKTVAFSVDDTIDVDTGAPYITPPTSTDYIMFGKNSVVNSSSILGYYAEAKFVNDSREKAELFSVGSEISESSK